MQKHLFNKIQIISLPFLMAIYPLSFLYYHNAKEMSFTQALYPLLISLLFSGVIFLCSRLIMKNTVKAAISTAIIVFISLNYGQIASYLSIRHRFLMPSLYFIGFYLSYFIYCIKNEEKIKAVSRLISAVLFILILLNIGQALPYEVYNNSSTDKIKEVASNNLSKSTPDIYVIFLDEFASLDTSKNFYHYNNDAFAEKLENMGFYVAKNSKTRTAKSEASMSTTLNMQFIYSKLGILTAENVQKEALEDKEIYTLLTHSKVKEYLAQKGYKEVYIGNWADLTMWKVDADIYYNYYRDGLQGNKDGLTVLDGFSTVFMKTTVLEPFDYIFEVSYDSLNHVRGSVSYALQKLKDTTQINGPKLVVAHMLIPHAPFVFGRNGETVDSYNHYNWGDKEYYLDQYIYITSQIEQVVGDILKNSKTKPIIIIQSDHGPRASDKKPKELKIPLSEQAKIFNAYYLPGIDEKKVLNDNISPVNSFRVIFNNYFNENYQILKDNFEVRSE